MDISIGSIQDTVWELASRIDAPKSLTTVFSKSPQDGRPHVEVHGEEIWLVTAERGSVFSEKKTESLDTLLYWLFRSITSQMAQKYELQHRNEQQDPRRIMFSKQMELMRSLSSNWHEILKEEVENILSTNPYLDPPPTTSQLV
jgi:hypothetical protein